MTGYLDRLVERTFGGMPTIQPRPRSRFEPTEAFEATSVGIGALGSVSTGPDVERPVARDVAATVAPDVAFDPDPAPFADRPTGVPSTAEPTDPAAAAPAREPSAQPMSRPRIEAPVSAADGRVGPAVGSPVDENSPGAAPTTVTTAVVAADLRAPDAIDPAVGDGVSVSVAHGPLGPAVAREVEQHPPGTASTRTAADPVDAAGPSAAGAIDRVVAIDGVAIGDRRMNEGANAVDAVGPSGAGPPDLSADREAPAWSRVTGTRDSGTPDGRSDLVDADRPLTGSTRADTSTSAQHERGFGAAPGVTGHSTAVTSAGPDKTELIGRIGLAAQGMVEHASHGATEGEAVAERARTVERPARPATTGVTGASGPPNITVTIGRVEVRPPPAPPPEPPPPPSPPQLSLADYLARRNGGSR